MVVSFEKTTMVTGPSVVDLVINRQRFALTLKELRSLVKDAELALNHIEKTEGKEA